MHAIFDSTKNEKQHKPTKFWDAVIVKRDAYYFACKQIGDDGSRVKKNWGEKKITNKYWTQNHKPGNFFESFERDIGLNRNIVA